MEPAFLPVWAAGLEQGLPVLAVSSFDPQFLSTVFAVTTLIATGLSGLTWGLVRTLRDAAGDLRARVKDLEVSRADDAKEMAKMAAENATLRSLVTGEVHWQAIADLLDHHHTEAQQVWNKVLPALQHIEQLLAAQQKGTT